MVCRGVVVLGKALSIAAVRAPVRKFACVGRDLREIVQQYTEEKGKRLRARGLS